SPADSGDHTKPPLKKDVVSPVVQAPVKREPVVLALEKFMANRPEEAMTHLKKYDAQTQEFFLRILPLIAQRGRKRHDQMTPQEIALMHKQLDVLLMSMRSQAELIIDEMCFCEYIEGYGNFKPLPK